ncbi:hypothetical protein DPM35_26945 [Mesorhizobium atlanticum]|uniref:Uncharacterized protein n=1 Tax=Mesorhizobium atlanticum TaxID=2233532 RepID=A0A330GQ33_9HYPH|nr:hypothetical protein DPM35_26945 [Mesorhizobium atlanticum]
MPLFAAAFVFRLHDGETKWTIIDEEPIIGERMVVSQMSITAGRIIQSHRRVGAELTTKYA